MQTNSKDYSSKIPNDIFESWNSCDNYRDGADRRVSVEEKKSSGQGTKHNLKYRKIKNVINHKSKWQDFETAENSNGCNIHIGVEKRYSVKYLKHMFFVYVSCKYLRKENNSYLCTIVTMNALLYCNKNVFLSNP